MAHCRDCAKSTTYCTACKKDGCSTQFSQCPNCFYKSGLRFCDEHLSSFAALKRKIDQVEKELNATMKQTDGTGPEPKDGEFWTSQRYCRKCQHYHWTLDDTYDLLRKRVPVCHKKKCGEKLGEESLVQIALCTGDLNGAKKVVLSIREPGFLDPVLPLF